MTTDPTSQYMNPHWWQRLVEFSQLHGGPPIGDPGVGLPPPDHGFAEARATCLLSELDQACHRGGKHGHRVFYIRATPTGPTFFSTGINSARWRSWDNLSVDTQDYLRSIPEDAWKPVPPLFHPLVAMGRAGIGMDDEGSD